MLVIAHRLSAVTDFDKILVMDNGQAIEYDTPKKLFASRGAFYSMLQESGELEKLRGLVEHEDESSPSLM
jgi:ABC-type multidrug transport system fused ATPase/permease subunit